MLHAGASGVGTAAIQLCQAFGSESFVTAGSAEKIEACYKAWVQKGGRIVGTAGSSMRVRAVWPQGADVILDPVGAGLPGGESGGVDPQWSAGFDWFDGRESS